jgi:hypothetical protein
MSSESVCQVARSWVDVGSFHMFIWSYVLYMTCGDFHNGSEKGTASVHQIFLQIMGKLLWSAMETLTMNQQAFRDQILSHTQVFQWHVQFKTSHTSGDNDEHTG